MNKRWSKRKVRRVEVNHPLLKDVPARIGEVELQKLLMLVRQGNEEACQDMVMQHLLLAKLKVQDFLSDYPHLKKEMDELVSIALLACVESVKRIREGSMQGHNNITGYIRVAIWRDLGDWVTNYFATAETHKPLPNQVDVFNTDESWIFEDSANDCLDVNDSHGCFEIKDVLDSLNLLDREWYVIESRMIGDTNDEIAEGLGVTEFTVRFILGDIQRRFLEKYEELQYD